MDTAIAEVVVEEGVVVPVVFTPNNDGVNDVFWIPNAGLAEYNLSIYNRWGELIFENTSSKAEWAGYTFGGLAVPDGTYFYILDLGNDTEPLRGSIEVKRD